MTSDIQNITVIVRGAETVIPTLLQGTYRLQPGGQGSAGLGGSPCRSRAKSSFLNRSTPVRLLEFRAGRKNTAGR
jgi:hypothetical protein